MNRLLIFDSDAQTYRRQVEAYRLPDLEVYTAATVEEADPFIAEVEILFGKPALIAPIIADAKRLHWVQSTFAGIELLCRPGLRTDYTLTGVKEIFGPLMREYLFCYLLARERSLLAAHRNQLDRKWSPISYRSLSDIIIGIVGLGSIGKTIAAAAKHFDMRVLGLKRTPGTLDHVDHLYLPHQIGEFLPQLDYLVLVLPDTEGTRHFISAAELQMMKNTAVLINVGRGATVNQGDLIEALKGGRLGGAILDVFEDEPLASDSPLWTMSQVVVTPHNSAFSFPVQIAAIFAENYRRYLDCRPLNYQVDFEKGY